MSSTSGPPSGAGAGPGAGGSGDGQYIRVRRRSRRSSKRRSARRNRLLLQRLAIAVAVISVFAFPAAVIGWDLAVTQRALIGVEAELRDARVAILEGDLVRAAGAVRSADLLMTPIPPRLDRPVWQAAARMPGVGRSLRLTRAIVRTANAGTTLARIAVEDDLSLLLEGLEPRYEDGRVALSPLIDVAGRLDRLDPSALRAALDELEAEGAGVTNGQLLRTRRGMLDLGLELTDGIERVRGLTGVLPGMLGAESPRSYLVVLQTSSELRGTGGLFGSFSQLDVDSGRVTLRPVEVSVETSQDRPSGTAVAVSTAFAERYGRLDAARSFSNVNLDPDLATSATVALDLYAARSGTRVDGLVLFDPFGMQALLEALDVTLVLPAELIEGTDAPATLPASSFARFVTVDVYDAFGEERSEERDRLTEQLGDQALAAVFGRSWDGPRVARALADASAGRHLQVFSRRTDEQAALATTPAGGDLAGVLADADRDVIAVTHNNAVGGKQDVHLGHRTTLGIELVAPSESELRAARGRRSAGTAMLQVERRLALETAIVNTLSPGAFDLYVTGNCLVGGVANGCFLGPEAFNRSWVTFWLDVTTTVTQVSDQSGFPAVAQGRMHGAATYDVFVEVPPREERSLRLEAAGPATVVLGPDDSLTYEILLWRQAKGIPDAIDVTVTAPSGYQVDDARLVGGRLPVGLADIQTVSRPAELRVRRGSASVTGAVGSDVTLTVRFRRVG